jgi:hypothetical protein
MKLIDIYSLLSSEISYVVVEPELLKSSDSFVGSNVVIASGKYVSVTFVGQFFSKSRQLGPRQSEVKKSFFADDRDVYLEWFLLKYSQSLLLDSRAFTVNSPGAKRLQEQYQLHVPVYFNSNWHVEPRIFLLQAFLFFLQQYVSSFFLTHHVAYSIRMGRQYLTVKCLTFCKRIHFSSPVLMNTNEEEPKML